MSGFRVAANGLVVRTHGLAEQGLLDLEVAVGDGSLLPEARRFLTNMGDALRSGKVRIHPGQTIQCGYWIVKFDEKSPGLLTASEPDADNARFVPGADLAFSYWRDQQRVCREQGSAFDPPSPLSLVACSEGVLEGRSPVGGTRYHYREGVSGWFLTTGLYDVLGNVNMHHAHHVSAARPGLVPYLALAPGHRFDHGEKTRVWFDPSLAEEEPW